MILAHRVERWMPILLAISVSSPYWMGQDRGYASGRAMSWARWPTSGPIGRLSGAAEYDRMVADLRASGVVKDAGMIYFNVRPSSHVPTLELRVCDSCPDVRDILLIAGLFRALVVHEWEAELAGRAAPEIDPVRARGALWRAARFGVEGDLVTAVTPTPAPGRELVARLVDELGPVLDRLGDRSLVEEAARDFLRRGSSAARQRRAFARRGDFADVVDLLVAETADSADRH
ncbi:hypothetical protein GCM10027294_41230 [Marinactinospora endophytica]